MSAVMRSLFRATPEFLKGLLLVAPVDVLSTCHDAQCVIDKTVDAVAPDPVTRPQSVHVVGKWPVDDTALIAGPVAAKTGDGVQDNGLVELSCVTRLVPVSAVRWRLVGRGSQGESQPRRTYGCAPR
jgi:hypothetical protein